MGPPGPQLNNMGFINPGSTLIQIHKAPIQGILGGFRY